ncbi:MAG: penicillin-binding protein activator LpoB [Bacteroidetes bacterium]|nr:penicillin-binding protein activator LpoB [Bacteroidota bacterium]
MKRTIISTICLITLFFLISCTGSSVYISPNETTQIDGKYSDTDMKMMAESMYNSIINNLENVGQKKVIALLSVSNKTSEHIDTKSIADKLQIQLLKSETLRFVDRSKINAMISQFNLAESGIMDPTTIKSAGKVIGADYFLSGTLSSIEKRSRIKSLTFYRLSMRLIDTETNEIVWADEFEIKKLTLKGFMDW